MQTVLRVSWSQTYIFILFINLTCSVTYVEKSTQAFLKSLLKKVVSKLDTPAQPANRSGSKMLPAHTGSAGNTSLQGNPSFAFCCGRFVLAIYEVIG